MQNLSFPTFQALYFAHTSTQRPDIQKIYTSHAASAPSNSPAAPGVICVSKTKTKSDQHPQPSSSKRRSSLAIMNFRSKSSSSSQPKPSVQPSTTPKHSADSILMSRDAFMNFLKQSQGMSAISIEEILELIKRYDLVCDTNHVDLISLLGFTHFMLSQEASRPRTATKKGAMITHSMTQPLSNYFIASSHNTYLTGH